MRAIIKLPNTAPYTLEISSYKHIEVDGIILYEPYPGCSRTYHRDEVTIVTEEDPHDNP